MQVQLVDVREVLCPHWAHFLKEKNTCNFTFCAVSSLKAGFTDTQIAPLTVGTRCIILTWAVDTFVNI